MVYEGKYVYGSLLDSEEVYNITSIRVWRATWKVMGDPRNEYSGVFKMWLELGVIAKSCRNE